MAEKKKILYIVEAMGGGVFTYIVDLANELVNKYDMYIAYELYHIYCYVEDADQSYIKNGSMLDSDTANETGKTQEDVEANAFAGLLLMPDQLLSNQIDLFGIDKDDMDTDSVLSLIYRDSLKTYNNRAMRLLREECRHELCQFVLC